MRQLGFIGFGLRFRAYSLKPKTTVGKQLLDIWLCTVSSYSVGWTLQIFAKACPSAVDETLISCHDGILLR